jgi:hypothetical protein
MRAAVSKPPAKAPQPAFRSMYTSYSLLWQNNGN